MPPLPARLRAPFSPRFQTLLVALLLLLIITTFSLSAWYVFSAPDNPRPPQVDPNLMDVPGIRLPVTVPASSAALDDDTLVIGVTAGGKARAYVLLSFFRAPGGRYSVHIVNDRLGGVPVTVSYCEQTSCARVFAHPTGREALDVRVGGWTSTGGDGAGTMLLLVGDTRYRQDTREPVSSQAPPFPYPLIGFVRTTWKKWREEHPDTDVYLGPDTSLHGALDPPSTRALLAGLL